MENGSQLYNDYQKTNNSTELKSIHPNLDPSKEVFMVYVYEQLNSEAKANAYSAGRQQIDDKDKWGDDLDQRFEAQKRQQKGYFEHISDYSSRLTQMLDQSNMSFEAVQNILVDFKNKTTEEFKKNPYDRMDFSIKQKLVTDVQNNMSWSQDIKSSFADNFVDHGVKKNYEPKNLKERIAIRKLEREAEREAKRTENKTSPS